jgi:hypothetical protein
LRRFSEPVGVVAPVPKQPVDIGQAAEQCPRPDENADLSAETKKLIERLLLSQMACSFRFKASTAAAAKERMKQAIPRTQHDTKSIVRGGSLLDG